MSQRTCKKWAFHAGLPTLDKCFVRCLQAILGLAIWEFPQGFLAFRVVESRWVSHFLWFHRETNKRWGWVCSFCFLNFVVPHRNHKEHPPCFWAGPSPKSSGTPRRLSRASGPGPDFMGIDELRTWRTERFVDRPEGAIGHRFFAGVLSFGGFLVTVV